MITIILFILAYLFVGSIIGARHHAIKSRDCEYLHGKLIPARYGNDNPVFTCFEPSWCNHTIQSVWFYGLVWPIALPVTAGVLIGSSNKVSRAEKRRAEELVEAEHKAKLARLQREEDEQIDIRLAASRR